MTRSPAAADPDSVISVAALKHPEGARVDRAISNIVRRLKRQGYRLAGAVRPQVVPTEVDRCALFLEELSSGGVFPISQDLGAGSLSCRLDDVALDAIAARVEASLQDGADLLVLNKFGKQEAEGRGLRSPIVKAVNQGIPVLVGLNPGRAQAWNAFCGGAGAIFTRGATGLRPAAECSDPATTLSPQSVGEDYESPGETIHDIIR